MQGKISLNTITIKKASFETKLEAVQKVGYDAVGLWMGEIKAYLKENNSSLENLSNLIKKHGLGVSEVISIRNWQNINTDKSDKVVKEAREIFEICKTLGCNCATAPAIKEISHQNEDVNCFKHLCSIATEYNVHVALEFIAGDRSVNNIKKAWNIVSKANYPKGGLLIDTFHFYRSRSGLDTLREIPKEKIFLVHFVDSLALPIDELTDEHRVFPGEGIIPLFDVLKVLKDKDYQGYFSLELFNEDYWDQDPFKVARVGKEKAKELLDKI